MSERSPRYSNVIQWSDEDQVYVASLPGWGDLMHTHGATYEEALQNGKELLAELIALRPEQGKPLPEPRVYAASA